MDELKWKMGSDMCGELGLWARGLERYNKKKHSEQPLLFRIKRKILETSKLSF